MGHNDEDDKLVLTKLDHDLFQGWWRFLVLVFFSINLIILTTQRDSVTERVFR